MVIVNLILSELKVVELGDETVYLSLPWIISLSLLGDIMQVEPAVEEAAV